MHEHTFHIPVMGTGHSIDTPIRVAHFGISSVVSIIDDVLLERVRAFYSDKYGLPYERIYRYSEDSRARRVTAYLDTVREIVNRNMDAVRQLPFFRPNDKAKYFELLPDSSPMKRDYRKLLTMQPGAERESLERDLTTRMRPGSVDVNIMTKLDRVNHDRSGQPLADQFTDAKAALRGFANSKLQSAVEFSAGLNRGLFNYLATFRDFYRTESGELKKKIVLKVSDFRSAMIQGMMLAKKGLEVHEFRIESGLNCGGHAFASNGHLLPSILKEFREKRDELRSEFQPLIRRFYDSMGWRYPESASENRPIVTVQGGIGNAGEDQRLRERFGMDRTGWATPFLLVPEATAVDDETRELLRSAGEKDVYLSDASPLGVKFNNIHCSGSESWTARRAKTDKPGSGCPKGFLVSNTEFTKEPICTASTEYQRLKLAAIDASPLSSEEKKRQSQEVLAKVCLCNHLGNGVMITLGMVAAEKSPQAICPGPNIAWFNRIYSLREMVDHIYGRITSLVPEERPHMFAKEIVMYVDHIQRLIDRCTFSEKEVSTIEEFRQNLEHGMDLCREVATGEAYEGENLASITSCVDEQRGRLERMFELFQARLAIGAA